MEVLVLLKPKTKILLFFHFPTIYFPDNDFNGAVVTTLYNHPGSIVIGDWPCYYDNGTVASNGGLPQQGNLTKHLLQV